MSTGGAVRPRVAGLRFWMATVIISFKPNSAHVSRSNRKTTASAILLCIERGTYNIQPENGWAWRVDKTWSLTAYFNIILYRYWYFIAHKRDPQFARKYRYTAALFPKRYLSIIKYYFYRNIVTCIFAKYNLKNTRVRDPQYFTSKIAPQWN